MKNIAIITGASSGLGKEFTIQLSQKNDFDEIWILARRKELLDEIASNINKTKNFNIVKPIQFDFNGKESVLKFAKLLKEEHEKLVKVESGINIKLLVNNAGVGTYGPFENTPGIKSMEMIELNCTTLTGLCYEALPYLRKDSIIINTASLAGFMPLGQFAVYSATKSYVLSFSIALNVELKEKGIHVCALCPGSVSTEFANVASNGARKEVKGGIPPKNVVKQCIKRAYKGKLISMYKLKWRLTAFLSRFVGRRLVAWYSYKFNPRPRKQEETEKDKEISVSDFL